MGVGEVTRIKQKNYGVVVSARRSMDSSSRRTKNDSGKKGVSRNGPVKKKKVMMT
jgi:hypothetical protein